MTTNEREATGSVDGLAAAPAGARYSAPTVEVDNKVETNAEEPQSPVGRGYVFWNYTLLYITGAVLAMLGGLVIALKGQVSPLAALPHDERRT